ncbi:MAG: hypothetical protein N2316_00735 [Spirochaetes bacterium]|nr:hypothetical protein [Spirochaetota bacterium]
MACGIKFNVKQYARAWCGAMMLHCACAFPTQHSDFDALKSQYFRKLSSYEFDPTTTLEARIKTIPQFLLNEVKKVDGRDDYRSYVLSRSEKKQLAKYLSLLPPRYREVLTKRLIGIFAISPFMGAGLADWVLDENNRIYAILILNPEVMKKTISEWLSYREASCFIRDDPKIEICVDAGNRYTALLYFLLHEVAHIVDYVEHHTPYVEIPLKAISKYPIYTRTFVREWWQDYSQPVTAADFPMRTSITFYGLSNGPKIPISKAKELYDAFSKSPFVTLYASQNWAEDFAETTFVYHIAKKLHQPYRIIVMRDGKASAIYKPNMNALLQKKFAYFRSFY